MAYSSVTVGLTELGNALVQTYMGSPYRADNLTGDVSIAEPPGYWFGAPYLWGFLSAYAPDFVGDFCDESGRPLAFDHTYCVVFATYAANSPDPYLERFYVHTPKQDGSGGWAEEGTEDPDAPLPQILPIPHPPTPSGRMPSGGLGNPDPARMVGPADCYDGRRRQWEVRAYRLEAGEWLRISLPPKTVQEAKLVQRREGGMAQLDVSMYAPLGTAPSLSPGNRLSLWVRERDGWVEWWRGYYQAGRQSDARPDVFEATAYGLVERLKGVLVDRQYAMAEQDLSDLFRSVLNDYLSPWCAETGHPGPVPDIRRIGVAVGETRSLTGNLAEVLTGLVKGTPGVTWGVDIDADGNERIYLRPRPSLVDYTVAYGHDAAGVQFCEDASAVVNELDIEGGTPLYPNLVQNGSFEKPANEGANLVLNPSFEDLADGKARHWTAVHGSPYIAGPTLPNNPSRLSPASGSAYLHLDNVRMGVRLIFPVWPPPPSQPPTYVIADREEVTSDPVEVTAGSRYELRLVMAAEQSGNPIRPVVFLQLYSAAGADIGTYDVTANAYDWEVSDQAWKTYRHAFAMPANTRMVRVHIGLPPGTGGLNRGIGVDDVQLVATDAITQKGWTADANDGAIGPSSVPVVGWSVPDPADGAYAVSVGWSTGNGPNCYAGIRSAAIVQEAGHELRLSFYAKADRWASTALDVMLWWTDGKTWGRIDPSAGDGVTVARCRRITLPDAGGWARYYVDFQTPEKCQQVSVGFGGYGASRVGRALLDAVYLHVGWPEDPDGAALLFPYIEAGAASLFRLTTEDDWFQDPTDRIGQYGTQAARDSKIWHSGPLAGTVHHGPRGERVSAPKVSTADDARRYAANYFNLHADSSRPSPIVVVDRIRNIRADGLMRLANLPDGRDGLSLYPVQTTHTFGRGGWRCEVERSEERGDLAALIAGIGLTAAERHQTLVMAGQAGYVAAQDAGTTGAGGSGESVAAAWHEGAGTDGASGATVALTYPVASGHEDDVQVWVNGGKWRQSLLTLEEGRQAVSLEAPDTNWTFSASDVIEVRYLREVTL